MESKILLVLISASLKFFIKFLWREMSMKYFLGKIGLFVLTLWAAITVNFFLPRLMPGSPADAAIAKLSMQGPVTPAMRNAIYAQFGNPHESIVGQYFQYLNQVLHFNFGQSSTLNQSVASLIGQKLPWTLILVGFVTILSFVIGTALGALMAWKRGKVIDTIGSVGSSFLSAFPAFWLGLILLYFFGYVGGIFPTSGGFGADTTPGWSMAFIGDALNHAVLPGLTILLTSLAGWIMGMRNTMITTLGEDYVTFAQANGLHSRTVVLKYAARNALLPNITAFGLVLGGVVGGSVLVETVFQYPGIGYLLYQSVTNHDYSLMQALFLIITVSVLVANFIVDMLYGVFDPRTRR